MLGYREIQAAAYTAEFRNREGGIWDPNKHNHQRRPTITCLFGELYELSRGIVIYDVPV